MAIHILGNGPSLKFFDRNVWPESDLFVGCNFSDEALRPHYTVIVDMRAMKQFRSAKSKGQTLNIPAVISDRANKYIAEETGGWDKVPEGRINVIEVIPLERDTKVSRKLAMNSGQHAVVHAIRKYPDIKDIHIWGTDSLWCDDLMSATDKIVRPHHKGQRLRPAVTSKWNKYWEKILVDHSNHTFVIHCPKGSKMSNRLASQNNIKTVEHE